MSDGSKIQWTDATWNPVLGCSKVSAGCKNCYAIKQVHRQKGRHPGLTMARPGGVEWTGEVKLLEDRLRAPLGWTRPRRVFVNSLSDLFHPAVPFEFIVKVWTVMVEAERHTFQVLTKRPERMAAFLDQYNRGVPRNIWLGTSVENQAAADGRIPHLLRCPAAVRFLSCEPLLGWTDLFSAYTYHRQPLISPREVGADLHWVIIGGESGPGARPFDLRWARGLVQECRQAGIAPFVKQLGARPVGGPPEAREPVVLQDRKGGDMSEWPADLRVREFPEVAHG